MSSRKESREYSTKSTTCFLDEFGITSDIRKHTRSKTRAYSRKRKNIIRTKSIKREREQKYTQEEREDLQWDLDWDWDDCSNISHEKPYYNISHRNIDYKRYLRLQYFPYDDVKRNHTSVNISSLPDEKNLSIIENIELSILGIIFNLLPASAKHALSCTSKTILYSFRTLGISTKCKLLKMPVDWNMVQLCYKMNTSNPFKFYYGDHTRKVGFYLNFNDTDHLSLIMKFIELSLQMNNTKITKWSLNKFHYEFSFDLRFSVMDTIYEWIRLYIKNNKRALSLLKYVWKLSYHRPKTLVIEAVQTFIDNIDDYGPRSINKVLDLICQADNTNLLEKVIEARYLAERKRFLISDMEKYMEECIGKAVFRAAEFDSINIIRKYINYFDSDVIALECAKSDAFVSFKWLWGYFNLYSNEEFMRKLSQMKTSERINMFISKMSSIKMDNSDAICRVV